MWTYRHSAPGRFEKQALRAEDEGWDGIALGESQNLTADPFVELGIAARFTSRIKLGTCVAVTATRHPATTATAIATVQAESGGRAELGIGTGSSAVAHLGLRPSRAAAFRDYLTRLQGYLSGSDVPFFAEDGTSSDAMGLASGPAASRLHWLDPRMPKVPVDVGATGPKMIAIGACVGDRLSFATGTSAERISWALSTARDARRDVGLDPSALAFGASFPMFVHPSRARARELIAGTVASFAHLATMLGPVVGPASRAEVDSLRLVRDTYDMNSHMTAGSPQSAALTDDVIDSFAIAGPPAYCTERLLELSELGLTKFVVFAEGAGIDATAVRTSRELLATEVLPALHRWAPAPPATR
jgi:5,10-methylenetetrahydromethanopterin reductase